MLYECHAHIFMDGANYKAAAQRYSRTVDETDIRSKLAAYRDAGILYIRDGGDHYQASVRARQLAPAYGIEYRTPVFAIHRSGQYGAIVGRAYDTMQEYHALVRQVRRQGGDFIKVMLSGIMDFAGDGQITGQSRPENEIHEMIHIAHEEGFAVMAHVNGDTAIRCAIEAGVDSIEHGNFMEDETIRILAASNTVWVPTTVTIGSVRGSGRFDEALISRLYQRQMENVRKALRLNAHVASGSDAGAFCVPHVKGLKDELASLKAAGEELPGVEAQLADAGARIRSVFHC